MENVDWIMTGFTFALLKYRRSMLKTSIIDVQYLELLAYENMIIVVIISIRYFERQFELAEAVKLPMFLHMRAAAEDFCHILKRNKERYPTITAESLAYVYVY